MYYQNVRGLNTKLNQLTTGILLMSVEYDIIIFTETWLQNDVSNSELGLFNYNIFRNDRILGDLSTGGGVIIAVHKKFNAKLIKNDISDKFEQCFVYITSVNYKAIVGSAYISPTFDMLKYFDHIECVSYIRNNYIHDKFILVGDYNLSKVKWLPNTNNNLSCSKKINTNESIFNMAKTLELQMGRLGLHQINGFSNYKGNILDLVFTSGSRNYTQLALESILKIDLYHPVLEVTSYIDKLSSFHCSKFIDCDFEYYDFRSADYQDINLDLSNIAWEKLILDCSFEDAIFKFYKILQETISKKVPLKRYKNSSFPYWFSADLKSLLFDKKVAHKNYKLTFNFDYYLEFSDLRTKCKKEMDKCYNNYISNIEFSLKKDSKKFWSYINNKNNSNNYPNVMNLNTKTASNPSDISNLFSEYFSNVYNSTDNNFLFDINSFNNNIPFEITLDDVKYAIKNLKDSLSTGMDGIPAKFIKECSINVAFPLYLLFSRSLQEGIVPPEWKSSYLTPIYKSGAKCNILNYRPITIINAVPKILDSIIARKINLLFSDKISTSQHGFTSGRSIITNLLRYSHDLNICLDKKMQMDSIYFDFKKAFDLVNHSLLIEKLSLLGFPSILIKWLTNYIRNRQVSVKIKNFFSNKFFVNSGVPQGTHIGPILFIIFINDILEVIQFCHALLFADDLKLYFTVNSYADCILLQDDIQNIYNWSLLNKLPLNLDKCCIISFNKLPDLLEFNYTIDNVKIKRVYSIRDLGVIFDHKLNFSDHYNYIIKESNKRWHFICRNTKNFKNADSIRILYLSLIRPLLLFAAPIWRSRAVGKIKLLERIQHKAVRRLSHFTPNKMNWIDHDYYYHSKLFDLPTIKSLHDSLDLITLYKIMHIKKLKNLFLDILPLNNRKIVIRHASPFYLISLDHNLLKINPLYRMCYETNSFIKLKPFLIEFDLQPETVSILIDKIKLVYKDIK